jgi:hypothetical protein
LEILICGYKKSKVKYEFEQKQKLYLNGTELSTPNTTFLGNQSNTKSASKPPIKLDAPFSYSNVISLIPSITGAGTVCLEKKQQKCSIVDVKNN